MSYLLFVAGFGVAVTYLFWARDVRIFLRTGLAGYRAAAYHDVAYATLSLVAIDIAIIWNEVVGLGFILLALYLQGRETREKVFSRGDSTLARLLGKAPPKER